MSYFSNFPKIAYDPKGNGTYRVQTDIFRRLKLRTDVKDDIYGFDYYDVQSGDTPESIAYKYYGDAQLHWTILAANDIVDYYTDWPMSVEKFEQYVTDKYDDPYAIHHYEVSQTSGDRTVLIETGDEYPYVYFDTDVIRFDTILTTFDTFHGVSGEGIISKVITNYDYEERLQDEKRKIRLIKPNFIDDFVSEFESKIA